MEFCELIEPRRESIVIEFEEDQEQEQLQTDEVLSNCNGLCGEAVEHDETHTEESNILNGTLDVAPMGSVQEAEDELKKGSKNMGGSEERVDEVPGLPEESPPSLPEGANCGSSILAVEANTSGGICTVPQPALQSAPNGLASNKPNGTCILSKDATSGSLDVMQNVPDCATTTTATTASTGTAHQKSPKRIRLRQISSEQCGSLMDEVLIEKDSIKAAKLWDVKDGKEEKSNRSGIPQR